MIVDILRKINKWADLADWHSWVVHGLIAVPITSISIGLAWGLMALKVHPVLVAGVVANASTWGYRELEQYAHERMAGVLVPASRGLDHRMDWVVPVGVSVGVSLLVWAFLL